MPTKHFRIYWKSTY